MKRVKKFRYWSEKKKRYVGTDDMPLPYENSNELELTAWDNDVYEVYIGLIVEGDRELCEGDIFQYTQQKAYNQGDFKTKVVYDNEHACFGFVKEKPLYEGYINLFSDVDDVKNFLEYCTIIGNIHENTEMFK